MQDNGIFLLSSLALCKKLAKMTEFHRITKHSAVEGKAGATPFVKWVGGKRSLLPVLQARLPRSFGSYYEPFVGGGALFFKLAPRLQQALLSDLNPDLVHTYQVVRQRLPELLEQLAIHKAQHEKDYYYHIRAEHELTDPVAIAARFIYLNKTCFNGLFRVNSKGRFNVPMGRYKNPNILDEPNLRACHHALQNVQISLKGYQDITPQAGDLVYFDPPYHPVNETSFTAYSRFDFQPKQQRMLRDFALKLHEAGVQVMLSNSNTAYIQELYGKAPFRCEVVLAPRFVNSNAKGRGAVEELLITNY